MLKFIIRFPFLLCALAATAKAGPYYDLSLHTSSATLKVSGAIKVAASSATANTPVITLDGANSLATIPQIHSTKTGPVLTWETGGATQSGLQGLFNFGYTSGFTIYDYQTPGNGRLGLGTPYGPQIYGKGYVGTPFLGINTPDPMYGLDVTGSGHFTSSVTAYNYYGDGTTLTGVATDAELAAVAVSTGAVYTALNSTAAALTAEISRATAREDAIVLSTGALDFAKLSKSGGTLTGNLLVGASVQANIFQGADPTYNHPLRVSTATYLATAPGSCGAGEFFTGMAADGTKTCATPAGGGDAVVAGTQTFTGANTFTGDTTLSGGVVGNTAFETATATTTFSGWVDIGRIAKVYSAAAANIRAGCGAGLTGISGGCSNAGGTLINTFPSTETGSASAQGTPVSDGTSVFNSWSCASTGSSSLTAYVICARVK